jgi:hypothetical protein
MIAANPNTTIKFGPSGSFINVNNNLEHTRDTTPRIINKDFLDLKFIFLIITNCVLLSFDKIGTFYAQ